MSDLSQFYMPDAISLASGTISATGAGSTLDTTGYQTVVLQLSGAWSGSVVIEASNDGSNWAPSASLNINEMSQQDAITASGIYSISVSAKYLRYNTQQLAVGTPTYSILGRAGKGVSAADSLSLAMDPTQNTPLNVNILSGLKKDASGALILSDMAGPFDVIGNGGAGGTVVIDTLGYSSIFFQSMGSSFANGAPAVSFSNDPPQITLASSNQNIMGVGFVLGATGGTNGTIGAIQNTLAATAGSMTVFACLGRYCRIGTFSTNPWSGVFRAYLSTRTLPLPVTNITHIGGTAVSNVGSIPVSGASAATAGAAAGSSAPVMVAGIDPGGLVRRVLTDTSGRAAVIETGLDPSGTSRQAGYLAPSASSNNVPAATVTLTDQFEGQSIAELLGQILLELRIGNQQRFDSTVMTVQALQQLLNGMQTGDTSTAAKKAIDQAVASLDEPAEYRGDPSAFLQ